MNQIKALESATTCIKDYVELDALIDRARREHCWLHCYYQDLWFSPDELARANQAGKFRWGVANWQLRDPAERTAQLKRAIVAAEQALRDWLSSLTILLALLGFAHSLSAQERPSLRPIDAAVLTQTPEPPAEHPPLNLTLPTWFAIAGQGFDGVSTYYAFHRLPPNMKAQEANPMLSWASSGEILAIKAGVTALEIVWMRHAAKKHPRAAKIGLYIFGAVGFAAGTVTTRSIMRATQGRR